MLSEEWHIPGDLNINLYQNGSILGEENKNMVNGANKISSEAKKYVEFCKTYGLNQLIKSATRVIHQHIHPYRSNIDKYDRKNYTMWTN